MILARFKCAPHEKEKAPKDRKHQDEPEDLISGITDIGPPGLMAVTVLATSRVNGDWLAAMTARFRVHGRGGLRFEFSGCQRQSAGRGVSRNDHGGLGQSLKTGHLVVVPHDRWNGDFWFSHRCARFGSVLEFYLIANANPASAIGRHHYGKRGPFGRE